MAHILVNPFLFSPKMSISKLAGSRSSHVQVVRPGRLRVTAASQRGPDNFFTRQTKANTQIGKLLKGIGIGTGNFKVPKSDSWEVQNEYLRANVKSVKAADARALQNQGYLLMDVSLAEYYTAHHPEGGCSAPLFELIRVTETITPAEMLKLTLCKLQGVEATRENKDFTVQVLEHVQHAGLQCKGVVFCCAFGGTTVKTFNFPTGRKSRSLQAAAHISRHFTQANAELEVAHLQGGLNSWFEAGLPGEGVDDHYTFQIGKVRDSQPDETKSEQVAFGLDILYNEEARKQVYRAQSLDQNDTPVLFSTTYMIAALLTPIIVTGVVLRPMIKLRMMEFMACLPWDEAAGMCVNGVDFDDTSMFPRGETILPATISLQDSATSLKERLELMQVQEDRQVTDFLAREQERAATELPLEVGSSASSLSDRLASFQAQQAELTSQQAADQAKALSEVPQNANLTLSAAVVAMSSLALSILLPARFAMTWFPKVERKRKQMPYAIVTRATDPLLNPLRGIFPRDQGLGGVDPSPVAALIIMSYLDEFLLGANGLLLSGVADPAVQNAIQALIAGQRVVFLFAALGLGFRITGVL